MAQENTVQLATRVHPEVFAVVEALVAEQRRSKADWLRELVEDHLKDHYKKIEKAG